MDASRSSVTAAFAPPSIPIDEQAAWSVRSGILAPPARRERTADPRRRPATLRGAIFEIPGVFYDDSLWSRWLVKVVTRLGLTTCYRSFVRLWQREYLCEAQAGRCSFCDAFAAFLRASGLSRPQIEEVVAACHARRETLEAELRLFPSVRSTLAALRRRGVALFAVCNTTSPRPVIEERLRRLAVDPYLAGLTTSLERGAAMPEAACYCAALQAIGCPPAETTFIGHDTAVLAGAKAMGLMTVAFNFEPDAEADVYLDRLESLLDLWPDEHRLAATG